MNIISWIGPILGILYILAIIAGLWIAGLWIAGKTLPAVISRIHSKDLQSTLARPFAKLILWLALGSLLSLPLMDLVILLGDVMNVLLNPQEGAGFSTLLGTIPQVIYFAFFPLLMLLVYGIIFWLALDFLSSSGQFNSRERIFMVLTTASLVHQSIRVIFTHVISFQIPILNVQQNFGIPGFLFMVLIGMVVIALIIIGLNKFLPTHPANTK